MPVTAGSIIGIIKDAQTGRPIEGVTISTSGKAAAIPSGSKGEYLLSDTEGTYTMWAEKPGYKRYSSRITIIGSVTRKKNFRMTPV